MILFYLLVSIMPLMTHPLWSEFVGDLTMVKYVGLGVLAYGLYYAMIRGVPPLLATWQARWFLLFAVLAMLSYTTMGIPVPLEVSPLFSYVSFVLLFFVTLVVVDSVERLRWVLLVAIGAATYASLHVLREWQKYGGFSADFRPGWVVGDPNYYTVSALLCMPFAYFLLQTRGPRWERWFCAASLMVTMLGVTAAASRGGLFGLAASCVLVAWRSTRRVRNFVALTALVLSVMVISPASPLDRLLDPNRGDQEATDTRLSLWAAGLRMLWSHPLTGVGTGNFKPLVGDYGALGERLNNIAHNSYVEIAAENGLLGIFLFVGMVISTLRSLERVRRSAARSRATFLHNCSQAIQAGLVGGLVALFFVSAHYQKLLWLTVFLSMCLARLSATVVAPGGVAQSGSREQLMMGSSRSRRVNVPAATDGADPSTWQGMHERRGAKVLGV